MPHNHCSNQCSRLQGLVKSFQSEMDSKGWPANFTAVAGGIKWQVTTLPDKNKHNEQRDGDANNTLPDYIEATLRQDLAPKRELEYLACISLCFSSSFITGAMLSFVSLILVVYTFSSSKDELSAWSAPTAISRFPCCSQKSNQSHSLKTRGYLLRVQCAFWPAVELTSAPGHGLHTDIIIWGLCL